MGQTLTLNFIDRLGKIVKEAVEKQDMLAWQFNTIGVSDGITMGGEGKIADLSLT
jgi:dihydroxy-acid dehydratase